MKFQANEGDVLSRITFSSTKQKLCLTKYVVVKNLIIQNGYGHVTLRMKETEKTEYEPSVGNITFVPISSNFTDDGIEIRYTDSDLFIMGDNPQTINKAKATLTLRHNKPLRMRYSK